MEKAPEEDVNGKHSKAEHLKKPGLQEGYVQTERVKEEIWAVCQERSYERNGRRIFDPDKSNIPRGILDILKCLIILPFMAKDLDL